jgi:pilus assembly protein Flp/PilA
MFADTLWKNLRAMLRDEKGATAVEYGLIVAALASAILVVISVTGKKISNSLNNVQSHL